MRDILFLLEYAFRVVWSRADLAKNLHTDIDLIFDEEESGKQYNLRGGGSL